MSTQSASSRWMILIGIAPVLLAVSVWIAAQVTGEVDVAVLQLPVLSLAVIGAGVALLLALASAAQELLERWRISRLMRDHWVKWQQYPSGQAWQEATQRERDEELEHWSFPWLALIPLAILFGIVLAVTSSVLSESSTTSPMVFVVLGLIFLWIVLAVIGSPYLRRLQAHARYRHCMRFPNPLVYIGASGLYQEQTGFTAFRGFYERLTHADYQPSQRRFVLRVVHASRHGSITETLSFAVPEGQQDAAHELERRLRAEVIR